MNIIRVRDYDEMSRQAALFISSQIAEKPNSTLGLATGGTPVGTYENLVAMHRDGLDFSQCFAVNLDEYEGLPASHPQSYAYFMHHNLFRYINLPESARDIPSGSAADGEAECRRYEQAVRARGVDLQLLGIGHNGHIGFNEPADDFPRVTHRVALTRSTLDANARYFTANEKQPEFAYTMGIGTIMAAKKILLIASGSGKAEIMRKTLLGEVTPSVPASILQFHQNVTVIADEAALGLI